MTPWLDRMLGRGEKRAADLSDLAPPPWSVASGGFSAGVPVTAGSAIGVPAISAAVRVASQAVATLELGVWRGPRRSPERVTRGSRARLLSGEPNDQQTCFVFKETLEESLTFRGNAYVWCNRDPQTGEVVEWFALHPDQVRVVMVDRRPRYHVAVGVNTVDPVGRGPGFYEVTREALLHVKGHGDGGMVVAPSPVERFRTAIGVGVAKQAHEARLYRKGAPIKLAIEYPAEMLQEHVAAWRDMWRQTYEGPDGNTTAVLGGGGKLTPIGLSMADAQFIESQNFTVSDVARMFAVPASLLDGGSAGKGADSSPLTPEHEEDRWFRYGLGPRLARIESAVAAYMFAGTATYPMFDVQGILRGDLATMEMIDHQQIQDGRLLPDEWRARNGLPPLPGGVGMVPQVTPVGGGANPSAPAAPAPTQPADESAAARGRGLGELRMTVPVTVHTPPVTIEQGEIRVVVPEQRDPVVNVNVAPTPVHVDAPNVQVDVAAPSVTVEAPNVQIDAPVIVETPSREVKFTRDPRSGLVVGATVEESN